MAKPVNTVTLPNGLPGHQHRLANGLDVWIIENHSAPVFTYQTWFRVGSRDEKLDPDLQRTGLAHLFEHMMFRGTSSHPDGDFDRILAERGANDQNATTWLDRTNYYESLPVNALEQVMELEADRMANLALDQKLLDTERDAVLGELRMGLDDPDTVAHEKLYELAYDVHPYRFSTMGTEEEIRSFTPEDARTFYRRYYAPNNAVLLIAGDVDPAGTLRLVQKHYGGIQAQALPVLRAPVEPLQTSEKRAEITHPQLMQARLLIGYHIPETRHPDHAPLLVARSLLSLGDGALLEQAWVNAGLAVEVSGSVNQFREPGLFLLSAELQEGHAPEELIDSLERELSGFKASPDSRQIERARNLLLLEIYSQWEDNSSLAAYMGEFISAAGDPMYAFELAKALEQVTASDVVRVLDRHLAPGNRTLLVARPPAPEARP
jgi:zinc protease